MERSDRVALRDFYRRMAKWMSERSPENVMWLICLVDAIRLSLQHAIVLFADQEHDCEFEQVEILIDKSFIEKSTHIEFWQEWLRNVLFNGSLREPMLIPKDWSQRDHPANRKYGGGRGLINWTDLFRNHTRFVSSADTLGVQIADTCANICFRFHLGNRKYRPYRLLRSRLCGRGDTKIHYGVLDESSLLRDAPENHVHDYVGEDIAALDEIPKQEPTGSTG